MDRILAMKTRSTERIVYKPADHDRPRWTVAPAEYTYFQLADGRVVPVLAGGMVEMAINTLGGVLRDVEAGKPRHREN
jgi:hypothetical protein